MKCRLRSLVLLFTTAFALIFCLLSTASAQTSYTAEDIGALVPRWGWGWSMGYAINPYGDVTGSTGNPFSFVAFLYRPTSGVTELGTLGGSFSLGTAINASDEVTGWSTIYSGIGCDFNPLDGGPPYCDPYHAFSYTPSGAMQDLGTLGGSESMGTGINANGDVVGWSDLANGERHGFLYSAGTKNDLGALDPVAINDCGEILSSNGRVFRYSSGTVKDLGIELGIDATAKAINNFRQITGYFDARGWHGFLYSGGTTTALGWGVGQSINNFTQVVGNDSSVNEDIGSMIGQIENGNGTLDYMLNPFLYTPGSATVQLFSLVTTCYLYDGVCAPWFELMHAANGINDAGQIAGQAVEPGIGNPFAFLFSPVTSSFSAFQAKLQITGKGETHFHLRGSFTLGQIARDSIL